MWFKDNRRILDRRKEQVWMSIAFLLQPRIGAAGYLDAVVRMRNPPARIGGESVARVNYCAGGAIPFMRRYSTIWP